MLRAEHPMERLDDVMVTEEMSLLRRQIGGAGGAVRS